jgi:hypothetical protein
MTEILHKNTIQITYPSGVSNTTDTITLTKTVSSLTEMRKQEIVVAASATITLWDSTAASENITDFDYLMIYNTGTGDLHVEFDIDADASVGEEFSTVVIPTKGHHVLFSKAAYANNGSGSFSGTLDTIEIIKVKEPDGVAGSLLFVIGT